VAVVDPRVKKQPKGVVLVSSPSPFRPSVYRLTRTRPLILHLDNAGYRTLGKPSQSAHGRPVWCELVQAELTIRY
jgi:hypothetical protein